MAERFSFKDSEHPERPRESLSGYVISHVYPILFEGNPALTFDMRANIGDRTARRTICFGGERENEVLANLRLGREVNVRGYKYRIKGGRWPKLGIRGEQIEFPDSI